jgi:GH15 family glucan-1,4-alpha-glucosidase
MTTPSTRKQRAPESLEGLARHSVAVIEKNQAETGAYIASPSFRVYRYCWFRDGAFIADAMSRAGRVASAEAFFGWCARILTDRSETVLEQIEARRRGEPIASSELLHCRYTADGSEAPEEWWNFQLDGYGGWLWALGEHARRHPVEGHGYAEAAALCAEYLTTFWAEPSYDWWEENPGHRHTSTLAAIAAGLRSAAASELLDARVRADAVRAADEITGEVRTRAVTAGRLTKWLDGDGIDASLVACATPFRLLEPDDPLMIETVRVIEQTLRSAGGGVHRHPDDSYFGGGEWPLLSALLGWYYQDVGRQEDARAQLSWIVAQATASGDLPEQVDTNMLVPEAKETWEQRWGSVATPLLWSHAMLLTLALELGLAQPPILPE